MRIGPACLAIETRQPIMTICAGLFAIVTSDAQILIDQQNVGCLANPVFNQEIGDVGIHVDDARETVLLGLDKGIDVLSTGHVLL